MKVVVRPDLEEVKDAKLIKEVTENVLVPKSYRNKRNDESAVSRDFIAKGCFESAKRVNQAFVGIILTLFDMLANHIYAYSSIMKPE